MRKIENKEGINDYKEYETNYKEMDKLTKDELIERYFYRIQKLKMKVRSIVIVMFFAMMIMLSIIIG